jgi:hypothetical protein
MELPRSGDAKQTATAPPEALLLSASVAAD